ncbi:glycosyltransferase [Bacillus sp. AGMB 02131]|uniref:Glycosyltransferase n=1 Tax=Peribacillus faecalis TaxID=2772559 RepID=A0A927CU94_9BACI|nr:glycosyltransferase [Peribacillus faecalis]MBD3107683.1 glycosyltransferase [Peribacillus faecalis]
MSVKVSVIIPVYNAEKYIRECIESLLNQTLQQCEFIFINDGSADNSEQIINEYKKIDNRIILINQENSGVSTTRNAGLHRASGEYIGFVDADDFVEVDMYEQLYTKAKEYNCDVVFCNYESEIDGHKLITDYTFPKNNLLDVDFINHTILPYFIKEENLNTVCNKIFKNKIIQEKNITFPRNMDLGEDGMFNISFFYTAKNTIYLDYTGYYYREVAGSATRNILKKNYFQQSLNVYNMELPDQIQNKIGIHTIKQFKSIKLIKSTIAYIHIYFQPSKEVSFLKRYLFIKKMISDKSVQESLSYYYIENQSGLVSYERALIYAIRKRLTIILYLITAYSRARNKEK